MCTPLSLPLIFICVTAKDDSEEVIQKAVKQWYAKSHGLKVEFSAEDATRSDMTFLTRVFTACG